MVTGIHNFAVRWLKEFQNSNAKEWEVEEKFPKECFALGFVMDCGQSFKEKFPGSDAFNNVCALEQIIDDITDVDILSSAVFSKYRYLTHWEIGGENAGLLAENNRKWFCLMLSRLSEITE